MHLPTLGSLSSGLEVALPLVKLVFDSFACVPHITYNSTCSSYILSDIDKRACVDLTSFNVNVAFGVLPLLPVQMEAISHIHHIVNNISSCVYDAGGVVVLVSLNASGIDTAFGASLLLFLVEMEVVSYIYNVINNTSGCVYDASDVV